MVKNPPAYEGAVRDEGSIPGSGRSPGGGSGNPFQDSCLENSMDREAWQTTDNGGRTKSDVSEQLTLSRIHE